MSRWEVASRNDHRCSKQSKLCAKSADRAGVVKVYNGSGPPRMHINEADVHHVPSAINKQVVANYLKRLI